MSLQQNRILSTLPADEMVLLGPHLELVPLATGQVLQDPGKPITRIYFVNEGLVSVLSVMADGSAVEAALFGREGVSGLAALLGVTEESSRSIVQLPGSAYVAPEAALRELRPTTPALQRAVARYAQLRLSMAYQIAACHNLHKVAQRCAFWLLHVADLTGSHELAIKHEFLAYMLGIRRASVSVTLRQFMQSGLITYSRGHITMIDVDGLGRVACECRWRLRYAYALYSNDL